MSGLQSWSSLICNTSARHERHKCEMSITNETWVRHKCNTNEARAIRVLQEEHESDTSATWVLHERQEWKILLLITTQVKTFSCPYIYYIGKWKITKRGTISFKDLPFGNVLFPCRNAFEKCTTKTELFNAKSCIKKLYTRL